MDNPFRNLSAPPPLTPDQLSVIQLPLESRAFLEGPAGTGKTTAGVERMLTLMEQGVPGSAILMLVPQRPAAGAYFEALGEPGVLAGEMVTVLTLAGLAQRMIERFWGEVAAGAGFARPAQPPVFLNFETAQYTLARVAHPLLEAGYFESVTMERNRIYAQILNNMNQAVAAGIPIEEIGGRLAAAWVGSPQRANVFEDVQSCALRFRQHCLEQGLLDFSLQIEVFVRHVWPRKDWRDELAGRYQHLIVDNLEEDMPVTHDLLREWLPQLSSALLIYDQDAGYRRLLGADPESAYTLKELCPSRFLFQRSFVTSTALQALERELAQVIDRKNSERPSPGGSGASRPPGELLQQAASFEYHRYFPQMLDWVAAQAAGLAAGEGVPAEEIAILAPYMSDSLRFALVSRLEALGAPAHSHRPSRAWRDRPSIRALLTLSALAHPQWGIQPARYDVAYALVQVIDGLDLVRAQLLAEIVYRLRDGLPSLSSFNQIYPRAQERITDPLGRRYEDLRLWLAEYSQGPEDEYDQFLSRLVHELLARPGFSFYASPDMDETVANLLDSVRNFRAAVGSALAEAGRPLGREYILLLQQGLIPGQYLRSWLSQPEGAVLLSPAYTYLLSNQPVEVQFWLDIGSFAWFERLDQPLTNPYVLSRSWPRGQVWTDEDEYRTSLEALRRLVIGLVRRCRQKICLGFSELNEQGYEQRGPLLQALQQVLNEDEGRKTKDEGPNPNP